MVCPITFVSLKLTSFRKSYESLDLLGIFWRKSVGEIVRKKVMYVGFYFGLMCKD